MQATIFDTFKDVVQHKVCTGLNSYNERTFATPVNIKCRIVESDTIVKNDKAELVTSKLKIYTKTKVSELDNLHGHDVLRIKEHKSLVTNEVLGYSIYL